MSQFAQTLIAWQARHGRHGLPWQASRDPYTVWLSEIMLQQTQVDTVIPYYQRFLARFPTLASLASAPVDDVLALWSGLGYYARARNLHRAAREVMTHHGGQFPQSAAVIATLPGIGRSTAAAIAAFCFGERAAILDGNVKRVLARHAGIEGFPGTRAIEQSLWALAESLLPTEGVAHYTQAMMDLGATVCTRSRPHCQRCPVAGTCVAHREGRESTLPTPRPPRAIPERQSRVLLARGELGVLLQRRPDQGIWGGLHALPEIPEGMDAQAYAQTLGLRCHGPAVPLAPIRHAFTHFRLTLEAQLCEVAGSSLHDPRWRWADARAWDELGLPTPIRRLLDGLPSATQVSPQA
ncbi:A/G-specific adenine glycosylase [Niveibacterium sp. 24ML]|uniref:A/G-specific adenine glycosylase n=1 Tax=Niveibacterium sp. 24ML TaxID=2985512 RepID=UPI00226E7CEF|nr:A/G-specific adenine glycosylase [Niveibacterium sp. 24ML]MCX9157387.1 A/G-specific adenine glycosylase [Niveibacterium sp. 24ML]